MVDRFLGDGLRSLEEGSLESEGVGDSDSVLVEVGC